MTGFSCGLLDDAGGGTGHAALAGEPLLVVSNGGIGGNAIDSSLGVLGFRGAVISFGLVVVDISMVAILAQVIENREYNRAKSLA